MIECRLCGARPGQASILTRVNELGVEGIWECRPACGVKIPEGEALMLAIKGEPKEDIGDRK